MFTPEEYHKLQEEAEKQGADCGANLAEWWWQDSFGGRGRGTKDEAEKMLNAFAEGDPAVYDSIPAVDFSGQWADGPNWEETLSSLVWDALKIDTDDLTDTDDLDACSDDLFFVFTDASGVMCEQWIVDRLTEFASSQD